MNVDISNLNPGQPGSSDPGFSNDPNPGANPNGSDPNAGGGSDTDALINESIFETRHRDATREIGRLTESNRLSQEQLREMAENYKLAKTELASVTENLQNLANAMKASEESGEILPAGDRIAYENAMHQWKTKKMELETKMGSLSRKAQNHAAAEEELSAGFSERAKSDALGLSKRLAPLVDGNQATMYQIIKNDIIPRIDDNSPHLVEKYRRGEISLETLVLPMIKSEIGFYKQLYGSRNGGNVDGGAAPGGNQTQNKSQTFSAFSGLL